jgi:fibronectin type 3 domain-containing protein
LAIHHTRCPRQTSAPISENLAFSRYYVLNGLTVNTTYYIVVSAENAAGEGPRTLAITVTTNNSVKPASPTGLTAGTITENSIEVSWNTVSGAVNYKVFAGTTAANMTLRGTPTAANFTITGLSSNTAYYIAVAAETALNESDQCTPVIVQTKPAAPSGLTVESVTATSINISWTSISGVTGYTVYAGTTEAGMTSRGSPAAAAYTITGLTNNTFYYIAVSAKNTSGEGIRSTVITVTTKLPAPGGLVASPQTLSSIQISWNALSGAASYNVYRSSSAAGTYTQTGTTPGTSYNDTGLMVSTYYYYKVSAVSAGNAEGEQSAYISALIPAQTNDITAFKFNHPAATGTINGTNISITVPSIVNLTALVPAITHNGAAISPASGAAQDFSSPVQYTVTAENGVPKNYTVTVTVTDTSLAAAFTWLDNNAGNDSSQREYIIIPQTNEAIGPVTFSTLFWPINIILKGGATEKTVLPKMNLPKKG